MQFAVDRPDRGEPATGARTGRLVLNHGTVPTPVFMPVATQASVKAIWPEDLQALGYRMILGNSYHLFLRPGMDRIRAAGGLHRFMSWEGNILTDSGGFQLFSLATLRRVQEEGVRFQSHLDGARVFLTPADVVANQVTFGSDVLMPLDVCTAAAAERAEAERAVELTHHWAAASAAAWRNATARPASGRLDAGRPAAEQRATAQLASERLDAGRPAEQRATAQLASERLDAGRPAAEQRATARPAAGRLDAEPTAAPAVGALFGIVQGHFHRDLRARSAEQLIALDLPGYAVGGLSVGESRSRFLEFLALTLELLPADRPRYVMGIGSPDYILEAVAAGADMFDCVYPTRVARNAQALTRLGPLSLRTAAAGASDQPLDATCTCRVCARYSRGYLRHLFNQREIMAAVLTTYHNLAFMAQLVADIRRTIHAGTFTAFRRDFLADYRRPGHHGD